MLILKLRNNSALHSKISSAVMLLFVGRKQTLLKFEALGHHGLLPHDPDLSMAQIGNLSRRLCWRPQGGMEQMF